MDLMTVEEVASKLRVKKSWVYAHANEIGVYRLRKYLRFAWPHILECLDRQNSQLKLPPNDRMVPAPAENAIARKGNGIKTVD